MPDRTFEEAARRIATRKSTVCSSPETHIPALVGKLREQRQEISIDRRWRCLFDDVCEANTISPLAVVKLVIRKQRDYGHDNILQFGILGIAVRVSDKWARIENLIAKGAEPQNESLRDSWMDIAGYALVAMMLEEGVFTLPLAEDLVLTPEMRPGRWA